MKRFFSFPLSIVAKTSTAYNKSFHAKIFTLFASSESEVLTFAKRHTPHYEYCYAFMKNDEGQWFLDPAGIERVRAWVLDGAKRGTAHVQKLYRMWQNDWEEYMKRSVKLLTSDFAILSDRELYTTFASFYENYLRVGSIAYSADSFMSTGEKDWLEELLREELMHRGIKTNVAETVRLLTSPVHLSFTLEEEIELVKLAMLLARGYPRNLPSLAKLTEQTPSLARALKRHETRFYWIRNNYYNVEYMDTEGIYRRAKKVITDARRTKKNIATLLKEKSQEIKMFRVKRERALAGVPLSRFHHNVLDIAKLFAKWKDVRKSGVYIGMHHFDRFLGEIGRRLHIPKCDLTFLVFDEIRDVFLNGQGMSKEIKARKQQAFFSITPKGYTIVGGEKTAPYFRYFMRGQATADVRELRGVAASPGKAIGLVHVIRKTEEMRTFKRDEILVTNQTTPEFVPIMKKAAAIVTEQGGVTSHAAIISRELHKPCIIGTKIATYVFKTGDRVEVDATKGVVRKI